MNLSDIVNEPQVHLLPLGYTQQQRSLLDMLARLHAKNVENALCEQPQIPSEDQMSDESTFDAFVHHCKQVINHPTMLVEHYMPKNLLLLNSKQNIVGQSQKYHYLNELLDALSDAEVSKTIVVSVTNAREMDLLESILIGKVNLQYYRFSGNSLYYEKNGMFELGTPKMVERTGRRGRRGGRGGRLASGSSSPDKNTPPARSRASTQSTTPTPRGRGRGRPRGSRGGRVGRPPINRTQVQGDGNDTTAGNSAVAQGPTTTAKMREEYTQKVSKNSPLYEFGKDSMGLKVYLILSQQLKYVPKLEELNLDMLISLDSNCMDFDAVANTMGKVPILKPLVVDSIEHFEWSLRNMGMDGAELGRLLTYLSFASFPKTKVTSETTFEEFVPLNQDLIKWIVGGCIKNAFPYPRTFETCVPLRYDTDLVHAVRGVVEHYKTQGEVAIPIKTPKFTFFDIENGVDKMSNEDVEMSVEVKVEVKDDANQVSCAQEAKKPRLNPKPCQNFPVHFTYREYQSLMAGQLVDAMRLMREWMEKTRKLLSSMHLSETGRQNCIDSSVVEMGELYKRDRDIGVLIEARNKVLSKSQGDLDRATSDATIANTRLTNVNAKKDSVTAELLNDADAELETLKRKIQELSTEISTVEVSNDALRQEYQQKSSSAAELSTLEKAAKALTEALEKQATGAFVRLKNEAFGEAIAEIERQTMVLNLENTYTSQYVGMLEKVQSAKGKTPSRR